MTMDDLNTNLEGVRTELSTKNDIRDKTLVRSRELIRHCAECIRAIHRREWDEVDRKLGIINEASAAMRADIQIYPDLYYSGYTQDALKEVVEAHVTGAMIRQLPIPSPADLNVEGAAYLNGLCEAATELRRYVLDIMRREDAHSQEAERLLDWMDAIYNHMVTFDFPDALTGGLRRQTDVLRGVLERTRGDLTQSLRQQKLQDALEQFETRMMDNKAP